MRAEPSRKLDPKVKNVWRINDAIWITAAFLCFAIPFALIWAFAPDAEWALTALLISLAAYAMLMVFFLAVLPPVRYARWRYELTEDFLDIARGIVWRKRFVIPFIRVQNTDTRQGPILRLFGLSSVSIATAAGEHAIPGVAEKEAERLRDRAAELARIAREDV